MSPTRTVAIANQKGGVGKTTTAVNLCAYLALSVPMLLIDLDPQANATSSFGLDPNGVELSTYDVLIGEAALDDAIVHGVRERYALIVVDCPPSLGILTLNALVAADLLLAPVQCEYLALEGVGQLMETLDLVRATLNPRLELLGMLMTMYDARTRLSTQVVEEVRSHFPTRTFETVIPRSVRLSEAPSFGKPVLEYEPTSRGAGAYADLAQEVLRRGILR